MALSTQTRIARSIGRSRRDVFLRADFANLGSPSRVTRAITELIKKGKLVRLGYGVYAKSGSQCRHGQSDTAKSSRISGG